MRQQELGVTHGGSLSHEVTSCLRVSRCVLFSHWIRDIVVLDFGWCLSLQSDNDAVHPPLVTFWIHQSPLYRRSATGLLCSFDNI